MTGGSSNSSPEKKYRVGWTVRMRARRLFFISRLDVNPGATVQKELQRFWEVRVEVGVGVGVGVGVDEPWMMRPKVTDEIRKRITNDRTRLTRIGTSGDGRGNRLQTLVLSLILVK